MSNETIGQIFKRYREDANLSIDKVIESTDGGRAEKIGYQEDRMHRTHKRDAIMGLRADAYTANANNFGVKKPQVKKLK